MVNSRGNIILFSVPRSGSTWLSEVLTYENNVRLVHEPDNELNSYFGLHHKMGLPRFPYLSADDHPNKFLQLFKIALTQPVADQDQWQNKLVKKLFGLTKEKLQSNLLKDNTALSQPIFMAKMWGELVRGHHNNQRTLVKTVHASLAIPFLMKHLSFTPLVLRRHPLNVYSSYVNLEMPDGNRQLYKNQELIDFLDIAPITDVDKQSSSYLSGYQLGLFEKAYSRYQTISEIIFVDYETIISNPFEEVELICKKLNLPFTDETRTFMKSKFKSGKGYNTNRNIDGHDAVWKKRLSAEQIDDFLKGYAFAFGSINFEV